MLLEFSTIPFRMGAIGFPGQQATEVRPSTLSKQKYLELMANYLRVIQPSTLYRVNTCWTRAEPRCQVSQGTTRRSPRWTLAMAGGTISAQPSLRAALPGTFSPKSCANPTVRHHLLPPLLPGGKTTHRADVVVPPAWRLPPPQLCRSSSCEALLNSRRFLIHLFAPGEVCQAKANHPLETLRLSGTEQGIFMQMAPLVGMSRPGICIAKQHRSDLMGDPVRSPRWERVTSRKVFCY